MLVETQLKFTPRIRPQSALTRQLDDVVLTLDILLRWAIMRCSELAPNTSALLRVLDWLASLLDALRGAGYVLREEEASLLLPVILDKSGHNLPAVRERFRRIMRASVSVYPTPRFAVLLAAAIASGKNSRSRSECLDELSALLGRHGEAALDRVSGRVLPVVASLVTERDPSIRKAALETLNAAQRAFGDAVWRHLGNLSHAQHAALELHLRKAAATRSGAAEVDSGGSLARSPPHAGRPMTAPAVLNASAQLPALAISAVSPPRIKLVTPPPANQVLADWTAAMATLSGADEAAAIGGMKVVCACLKDMAQVSESASAVFASDANELVSLLTSLVTRFFDVACAAESQPAPSRGCRYALNALMQTFSVPRVAVSVAEPTLRRAVGELLMRLLDDRVARLDEGSHLVRALNVLMLRVLENANRTVTFVALLLMLRSPPPALLTSDVDRRLRFAELSVKCLIKLTRSLGASLAGLDVSELLLTIHSFFLARDVDDIRCAEPQDERPLRMVKTVLFEACDRSRCILFSSVNC